MSRFFLGVSKPEDQAMHAPTISGCSIEEAVDALHAIPCRRFLDAVDAQVAGRRLSPTELARQWLGAERMHSPLKALDRVLGDSHLHAESADLHRANGGTPAGPNADDAAGGMVNAMAGWAPVCLPAPVAMGGHAMPVYEKAFAIMRISQPEAQPAFSQALQKVLPPGSRSTAAAQPLGQLRRHR